MKKDVDCSLNVMAAPPYDGQVTCIVRGGCVLLFYCCIVNCMDMLELYFLMGQQYSWQAPQPSRGSFILSLPTLPLCHFKNVIIGIVFENCLSLKWPKAKLHKWWCISFEVPNIHVYVELPPANRTYLLIQPVECFKIYSIAMIVVYTA